LNLTTLQEQIANGDKIVTDNSSYDMSIETMKYLQSLGNGFEVMRQAYFLGIYMGMKYQQRHDYKKRKQTETLL